MTSPHGATAHLREMAGFPLACSMLRPPQMLATGRRSHASSSALTRIAEGPRLLDTVLGRLLEIVVLSVEGARERLRGRAQA